MKVLMISKACLVGNYQTKLEEIAKFPDIDLTVIVPPVWKDAAGNVLLERSHTTGYRLLVEPIRFNGQYHLFYFPTLKQQLQTIRPDILHIDEEPYNLASWLAWRQGRAVGAKTLFFSWQNIEKRYPWPFRMMEQQVLRGVDYALMGNQEAAMVWQRKGYTRPYRVIPQFGVDTDHFSPPPPPATDAVFTIGAANRRLTAEKGVDLLLQAVANLPGAWQVRIAGEGPARPSLEQLARELHIADRVLFDGPVSSAEMAAYLQQLDVLVLSSRTTPRWKEQFGRVLIEAMACEVVVVGSDSGEIPHVIGEAGLLFAEDDVAGLQAHLQRLMQTEGLRKQYGRDGRARVLAHYSQQQIAAQTVAAYREILAE